MDFGKTINKKTLSVTEKSVSVLFVIYFFWWLYTQFYPENVSIAMAWGLTYWIMAFFGAVTGLLFARYWGGVRSIIGRTILAISIGLFLQAVGQNIANYYVLNELEV